MDMTIDEFYKQLSNVYETGSPEAVELYLNDCARKKRPMAVICALSRWRSR